MESSKKDSSLIQDFTPTSVPHANLWKQMKHIYMTSYMETVFNNTDGEVNYVQVATFMEESWKNFSAEIRSGKMQGFFICAPVKNASAKRINLSVKNGELNLECKDSDFIMMMMFYIPTENYIFVNYVCDIDFNYSIKSALKSLQSTQNKPVIIGNRKVYRKFEQTLKKYGVDPIDYNSEFPYGRPETHDYFVLKSDPPKQSSSDE